MSGRDPHEPHRVATPLELLFDLTFVVAFGVSASQFAHMLTSGHAGAGLAGFAFATFAVCWAWINFSWFASAYDTDDWVYRLTTMLQMVGVLVLALGIPQVFSSIAYGHHVDNRALVGGYVVMRVAMVIQWLRAARQDPARKVACLSYACAITIAQVGWVVIAIVKSSLAVTFILIAVMIGIELIGPLLDEKRMGGTPWHAHRERSFGYGYLHIVLFGSIVATGAGLHAAADYIEHRSAMNSVATVLAVAVPVGVYVGAVYGTYLLLTRTWDGFFASVVLMTLSVLGAATGLASAGVSTPVCLLVVAAAPAVVVASVESRGHRRTAEHLQASIRPVGLS
jgi:low temperature requirement protein LtrA